MILADVRQSFQLSEGWEVTDNKLFEEDMNYDFSNRVAAITGAAGNLGLCCAQLFFAAGARLFLIDRAAERIGKLAPDLAGASHVLLSQPTDVTDPDAIGAAIQQALSHFGQIDVLVNTAGGYRGGLALQETPLADWDFLLNLNARSVFLTSRAVLPHMIERNQGRIISTASRAALSGEPNHSAYSASKTAVVRLTETMAAELKDHNIGVNCVLPGMIDTPQNRAAMPDADFSRWVQPEAIGEVILFLASDAARAVRGASIPVFG